MLVYLNPGSLHFHSYNKCCDVIDDLLLFHYSSVSVWAKNCEALSLRDDERRQLNTFIDKLYSDMDDG